MTPPMQMEQPSSFTNSSDSPNAIATPMMTTTRCHAMERNGREMECNMPHMPQCQAHDAWNVWDACDEWNGCNGSDDDALKAQQAWRC